MYRKVHSMYDIIILLLYKSYTFGNIGHCMITISVIIYMFSHRPEYGQLRLAIHLCLAPCWLRLYVFTLLWHDLRRIWNRGWAYLFFIIDCLTTGDLEHQGLGTDNVCGYTSGNWHYCVVSCYSNWYHTTKNRRTPDTKRGTIHVALWWGYSNSTYSSNSYKAMCM